MESWISEDKEVEIKQKCVVRLRLLGVTCDSTEIARIQSTHVGVFQMLFLSCALMCAFGARRLQLGQSRTIIWVSFQWEMHIRAEESPRPEESAIRLD